MKRHRALDYLIIRFWIGDFGLAILDWRFWIARLPKSKIQNLPSSLSHQHLNIQPIELPHDPLVE
jgi:hypothetical protein